MRVFELVIFAVALLSGATASLVGFGIGSLLTPLIAMRVCTPVAGSLVTLPHAVATALRCWRLRRHIDRGVLARFGLLSAAGALSGAIVYTRLGPGALTVALGCLLLLTSAAQLSGWTSRWQPQGVAVAVFGVVSGFFGGVAGNQGGLRSAAMLAFGLPPLTFVATATATGLVVDAARTPVYLWYAGPAVLSHWPVVAIASAGVVLGTLAGERLLFGLSRRRFGQFIGVAIGILGLALVFTAG